MPRSVSVVVPVKDGARYLGELLTAVFAQAEATATLDVLVIDSGSTDGSVAIATAAGARVLRIPPAEFGHGRTRNLGAREATGEIVVFLTQDATPLPGWLDGLLSGFDLDPDVAAVYGPHLARPETSPMIARELETFFAGHAIEGGPAVQRAGGEPFLSNVNAAYRRDVLLAIGFDDVPYSEDQAFARRLLAEGHAKAYVPAAAVLHAHDYPPVDFMRRYFDEYRGLRQTVGHVERIGVRSTVRDLRHLVGADRAWMRAQGYAPAERRRWLGRSLVHHTGRKTFSALGSRAHTIPEPLQRRISLEGTATRQPPPPEPTPEPAPDRPWPVPTTPVEGWGRDLWNIVLEYERRGPAPLLPPLSGQDGDRPLHVACVIPPFARGSGGHNSIFQILSGLEARGHTVSIWLDDPEGHWRHSWGGYIRSLIREWFAPIQGPVFNGFRDWYGADIVLATGWQTAHQTMLLPHCRARGYLVHDHETEFYATSAESVFAEATYGLDMHAICSSPWLESIVRDRYGRTTSTFDFGVDLDVYAPQPITRREDTVLVYGRAVTPRRAVPIAILALAELRRRRPDVRIQLFGNPDELHTSFDHEQLGILDPEQLAWAYSEATIGLVLSLTNYSLIPQEMLACGLPCVDLAGVSAEGIFGTDGAVTLTPPSPLALCDTIERLLDAPGERERRSAAGVAFVQGRTWTKAAEQVEQGIREAFRQRT